MIITHLGNGIVRFDNVFDASIIGVQDFISRLEENTKPQGYVEKESLKVNEGGYEFSDEFANSAPSRYTNLNYSGMSQDDKDFVLLMNDYIYLCLVEYCRLFPVVIDSISWQTNGYIIKYEKGQYIGPHSDSAIAYEHGSAIPVNTSPMHNTLTVAVFLNDDFVGGNVRFRPWAINSRTTAGSVMIYPATFTGCHEVEAIESGVRYAYLSWFAQGDIGTVDYALRYEWIKQLRDHVGDVSQKFISVGIVNDL